MNVDILPTNMGGYAHLAVPIASVREWFQFKAYAVILPLTSESMPTPSLSSGYAKPKLT